MNANQRAWKVLAVWLVLAGAAGIGLGDEQDEKTPQKDTCVVVLSAPVATKVTVDGDDFGTQRRFEFSTLTPGRQYSSKFVALLPDGTREERTLTLIGGQVVRVRFGPEPEKPLEATWNSLWGLYFSPLTKSLSDDLNFSGKGLVVVVAVVKAGAADKAGLKSGDVLLDWDVPSEKSKTDSVRYSREGKTDSTTLTTRTHDFSKSKHVVRPKRDKPRTIIVDQAGKGDFKTITAALALSHYGDTIEVRTGIYEERVVVPSGVTIRVEPSGAVNWSSATCPVFVYGVDAVTLEGLTLDGTDNAIKVQNASRISIQDCDLSAKKSDTIQCTGSEKVMIKGCSVQGTEKTRGLYILESEAEVRSCLISNCQWGIVGAQKAEVVAVENIVDNNRHGILVFNSELQARGNSMAGTGKGTGVYLKNSKGQLVENSVLRHEYGIETVQSQTAAVENSLMQNDYGIILRSGKLTAQRNTVIKNQKTGVVIRRSSVEGDSAPPPGEATLEHNRITENGLSGLLIIECHAQIKFNLIDKNNNEGIGVNSGTGLLDHNTIVNNRWWGVRVSEGASARIHDNAIVSNRAGLFVDVMSKTVANRNAVYGNLATSGVRLTDGNYGRRDRLVLSTGQRVPVWVFPANELRGANDINENPRFMQDGSDYRPQSSSPLVTEDGYLGAFPPVP